MKKWTSRKRTAAADQTKKQQQQRASNATGEGDEEYENGSNTATESSCSSNSTDTVQTDYERLDDDDDDDDDDNNNRNMSNTGNTNNNDNIISSHYKSPTYDEEKDSTANDSTASTNLHLHTHNQQQNHHQHPSDEHIIKEVFQFLVRRSWKKKLCTLLVVLSTIPVLLDIFILRTGYISSNINNFLHWMMTHPILGVFAYIALLIATSLIFLPPSVLIFASGFIFTSIWPGFVGIIVALLASYIASTIGGLIGFARAKYMTRDLVKVFMRRYPIVRAVDAAIVRNSLRVMILMRLNCLLPFGVINYVFGISGAKAEEFVLSMVGVVPWHLLLICLGASSASFVSFDFDMQNKNNGADEEGISVVKGILMAMGVAFGLIGFAITWKFARKELQKEVDSLQAGLPASGLSAEDAAAYDLSIADYFLIQWSGSAGMEVYPPERDDYQAQLTWNEVLLDDFA